jgi:hypothetical protein
VARFEFEVQAVVDAISSSDVVGSLTAAWVLVQAGTEVGVTFSHIFPSFPFDTS